MHLIVAHGFLTIRAKHQEEKQNLYRTKFRNDILQDSMPRPESANVDKIHC